MSTLIAAPVVIGLSAVIVALREGEACVLTVRPRDAETGAISHLEGLPFGPFDPTDQRTFDLALRQYVTTQTRFDLGYVEQLYTFGDKGRDAPLADVGAGAARVISVGYLALAPDGAPHRSARYRVVGVVSLLSWEDWRAGRPHLIDAAIIPALDKWSARSEVRQSRARLLFAQDGAAMERRACPRAL